MRVLRISCSLGAGFSPRRPWFSPRSVHMGFVADTVVLRQVFCKYIGFFLLIAIPVNVLFLSSLSPGCYNIPARDPGLTSQSEESKCALGISAKTRFCTFNLLQRCNEKPAYLGSHRGTPVCPAAHRFRSNDLIHLSNFEKDISLGYKLTCCIAFIPASIKSRLPLF
jgi:hypothetical protein